MMKVSTPNYVNFITLFITRPKTCLVSAYLLLHTHTHARTHTHTHTHCHTHQHTHTSHTHTHTHTHTVTHTPTHTHTPHTHTHTHTHAHTPHTHTPHTLTLPESVGTRTGPSQAGTEARGQGDRAHRSEAQARGGEGQKWVWSGCGPGHLSNGKSIFINNF